MEKSIVKEKNDASPATLGGRRRAGADLQDALDVVLAFNRMSARLVENYTPGGGQPISLIKWHQVT